MKSNSSERDLDKNGSNSTIFKGLFVRRSLNRKSDSWPDHTKGIKNKALHQSIGSHMREFSCFQ
jgi:hypothetical protein